MAGLLGRTLCETRLCRPGLPAAKILERFKSRMVYRQNIILYVRRDRVEADPKLQFLASLQPPEVIRFRRN